jgi:hypothetical protein
MAPLFPTNCSEKDEHQSPRFQATIEHLIYNRLPSFIVVRLTEINPDPNQQPCILLTDGPDSLLANAFFGRAQQFDEGRNGPGVNDGPRLLRAAAGNVGEGPRRLKLQHRGVGVAQKFNKSAQYKKSYL